jgi:hypothetical protein
MTPSLFEYNNRKANRNQNIVKSSEITSPIQKARKQKMPNLEQFNKNVINIRPQTSNAVNFMTL